MTQDHPPSDPANRAPRRIGLGITELEVGGAERCLVELATRLDRRRFEPRVFALSPPPPPGQTQLIDRLASAGVAVTFLGGRGAADAPRTVKRFRQALLDDRIELLQTFLFHANVLGALAVRLPSGVMFSVGTGFSDKERGNPPPLGATITFR